jgi:hypothetical protein
MTYLNVRQEDPTLGYFGIGRGCGCSQCGETGGRRPFLGEPPAAAAPAFRIDCPDPPGCPPAAAGQCRAILRDAIREAIKLANNAASKLEARDPTIVNQFRFFFHHPPSHPIPWADGAESAASVAKRYRAVAMALQTGGRNTTFRCLPVRADCADNDMTCCLPTTNAWVQWAHQPNVLNLCASFWNPPPGLRGLPAPAFRAGIILHEMLHLLFHEFLLHGPRRANSHCYEAFALRAAGFGVEPTDICMCRGTTPCPP